MIGVIVGTLTDTELLILTSGAKKERTKLVELERVS
jgi:hypothetical protein